MIEIAGNRFPTYFDSDEKLFCMTRSIHLYRELTCDSVLKRYPFLDLQGNGGNVFLAGLSMIIYQSSMKSNSLLGSFYVDNSVVPKKKNCY